MIAGKRIAKIVWVLGALIISYMSFLGGDVSIIGGWLFLLWTLPFGVVWWFWLYDIALKSVPAHVLQPVGTVSVIILSYVFWFILVPKLRKRKES